MNSLSFGVMAGEANADVAHLESLPIDSLWVGGHVASTNPSPEAMMALAWLAARTERVRVGTAVLLLPLYPPAIVAKQIADLDRATGGRVTLGVGVGGEYPGEFRAAQVPLAERGARADEAIPLLRTLWSRSERQPPGSFLPDGRRAHPSTPGADRAACRSSSPVDSRSPCDARCSSATAGCRTSTRRAGTPSR